MCRCAWIVRALGAVVCRTEDRARSPTLTRLTSPAVTGDYGALSRACCSVVRCVIVWCVVCAGRVESIAPMPAVVNAIDNASDVGSPRSLYQAVSEPLVDVPPCARSRMHE
jgi:hypothetical protein